MNRFRELRKEKHLTQAELINQYNQRYDRTYSIPALSLFENGHRLPELPALQDFADFFGVSVDYLLGRSDIRVHLLGDIQDPNHPMKKNILQQSPLSDTVSNWLPLEQGDTVIQQSPRCRVLVHTTKDLPDEAIDDLIAIAEVYKKKYGIK